jgi:hypothetical protein
MSEQKNEKECLEFEVGGNAAPEKGGTESHGGPYAVNGIKSFKNGDSKDKDSK